MLLTLITMGCLVLPLRAGNTPESPRLTASSVYVPEFPPSQAMDGDLSTYWSSTFQDDAWLAVDLGAPKTFTRLSIVWEAAYAKEFVVQASKDGLLWTEIYKTADGRGGTTEIKLPTTEARHLRIVCTQRGTPWGNAIREIVVRDGEPQGKLYFSFFSLAFSMDRFWGHGTPLVGIQRTAEIAHANGIPVTWLVDSRTAEEAKELFTHYHETYGDDVALMLPGYDVDTASAGGDKAWFRSLKYPEMKALLEKESAAIKRSLPWAKLEILGACHRTDTMVRAAEDLGFKALWGHCWEQTYTDDISDRGTPWGFYYASRDCFKAPAKDPGGLVAVEWTARDLNKAFHTGNPIAYSTDPNEVIRSKPQLCDRRQIDYWKRLAGEYQANAEWNAVVPLVMEQESHEMENTEKVRVYSQQDIDNSADILDEFFKYIKSTDAVIVPASKAVEAYRQAHPSTPSTYAFVRDVTPVPITKKDKDLFIYYDVNGQLFFDRGKAEPVLIRNYLGIPDPYGHDFAGVKEVPAARITETRDASGVTFDCTVTATGPLPYGFAFWGDYTGRTVSVSAPAVKKVIDGELAYVGVVLKAGENHFKITITRSSR